MIFIELSFQTYYSLVYLVQDKEITGSNFVRSKEVKYKRDSVEGEGVNDESMVDKLK